MWSTFSFLNRGIILLLWTSKRSGRKTQTQDYVKQVY